MSTISWKTHKEAESTFPHKDYRYNLNSAQRWMTDNFKQMSDVFSVTLADSHNEKNALIMFKFNPGMTIKMGKYGHPISLHQDVRTFDAELENVARKYLKLVTNYFNSFKEEHMQWKGASEKYIKECPFKISELGKYLNNTLTSSKRL